MNAARRASSAAGRRARRVGRRRGRAAAAVAARRPPLARAGRASSLADALVSRGAAPAWSAARRACGAGDARRAARSCAAPDDDLLVRADRARTRGARRGSLGPRATRGRRLRRWPRGEIARARAGDTLDPADTADARRAAGAARSPIVFGGPFATRARRAAPLVAARPRRGPRRTGPTSTSTGRVQRVAPGQLAARRGARPVWRVAARRRRWRAGCRRCRTWALGARTCSPRWPQTRAAFAGHRRRSRWACSGVPAPAAAAACEATADADGRPRQIGSTIVKILLDRDHRA